MSRKFLSPVNLLHLADDPASGSDGDIYFNTTSNVIKVYYSSAWNIISSGSSGGGITVSNTAPSSPSTGDAWYKNDTGEFYIYDGTYWVEVNGTIQSETFKTISVSGQSDVVADSASDTLTLIAGTNVGITTNATNDSITINSTGNYTSVDSITYPDYITFDTTPETIPTAAGSIYWDSGDGVPKTVLNANVELGIGQEQVALVKNATGSSIAKGKVVYINGAQGQRPTIALSDADTEVTSSKTLGLAAETIADGAEGFITTFGVLRGVNTNGLTEGAALWLSSTAGGYTTTAPTDPAHLVFIGYVVKAHETSGEIFVNPQNGYELNELHDVLINGVKEDSVIRYDLTSGLWKNTSPNVITAKNTTEATIDAFTPVYINSQIFEDTVVTFVKADASQQGTLPANAITVESVPDVTLTKLVTSGIVTGVTLTGYSNNDLLYVANGGGFTNTRPTGSNAINPIARVLSVDNGTIYFFGSTFASSINTLPNLTNNKIWLGSTGRPTETTLDTSVVPENSNLYFTDERAQDATASMITNGVHSGISVEYVDSSNIFNLTNTGVTSLSGTTGEIEVSSSTGGATIGLPDQVTINDQLTIGGTNKGNIVLKNASNTVTLELQADATGAGSITAGTELGISVTNGPISISAASGSIVLTATNGEYLNSALSTNQIATHGWVDTNYLTQSSAASTYQPIGSYLTSETDPVFTASAAYGITSTDKTHWTDAYNWGDHSLEGYLTSYSETSTLADVTGRGATTSSAITITNATASSSTTTGALIVTGGVGIGEDLYVNNNVYIGGNVDITGTITGSLTLVDVTNLAVTDPLIYLAEGNASDAVDIGIFAALNHGGPSYNHTGLIRDSSDSGKWKLVSGLDDPTANVIDFTGATYDTLKIGALEVTNASTTRTNLGLAIGTDVQAYNATLAAVAGGTYSGDDSITTVGTISSGTWNATAIGATKGGTGLTSYTKGDILYASATNTVNKLSVPATNGWVLTFNSTTGLPEWSASSGSGGLSTLNTPVMTTSPVEIAYLFGTNKVAEAIVHVTQGTYQYASKIFINGSNTSNEMITEYAILDASNGLIPLSFSYSGGSLYITISNGDMNTADVSVVLLEVGA